MNPISAPNVRQDLTRSLFADRRSRCIAPMLSYGVRQVAPSDFCRDLSTHHPYRFCFSLPEPLQAWVWPWQV